MHSTRYQDIIQQPKLLHEADISLLKSWVENYPQVPLFRALLAAKGMQDGDNEAGKWLETAAIYAADRRQLKRLIQQWNAADRQRTIDDGPLTIDHENANPESLDDGPLSDSYRTMDDGNAVKDDRQLITDHENAVKVGSDEEDLANSINESLLSDENVVEDLKSDTLVERQDDVSIEATDTIEETVVVEGILSEEQITAESAVEEEVTDDDGGLKEERTDVEEHVEADVTAISIEAPAEEVLSETVLPEVSDTTDAIHDQWADDDIEFLKAIGKWEGESAVAETRDIEADWQLEAPGRKIHVLKLTDILDQGLVQTDIRWLAPWLEDFQYTWSPSQPVQEVINRAEENPVVESVAPEMQYTSVQAEPIAPSPEPMTEDIQVKKEADLSNAWSSTHSFEEWLTILAQKQKSEAADAPIFDLPHADLVKDNAETDEKATDADNLAANETTVSPGEEEVKKMAEESISVRDEMATETLARIYVKQGKISHALKVYQILMQKYPEKSSYFAAQIQQLKAE